MKRYSTSNIYIDYDGIQCECYLSKKRIKKAVYNCVYGALGADYIKHLEKYDVKASVYWHYGWCEPVLHIPMYDNYIGGLIGLGKYLGWRHCDEQNI